MQKADTLVWMLPRPRMKPYYKGGFPLHFESNLLELLGFDAEEHHTANGRQLSFIGDGDRILHPFGGRAEYGFRVDINSDVRPHVVADAHCLPFRDDTFACVIVDPPYSDELSKRIYNTGKIRYNTYVKEAVRVARPGGYVVLYHVLMLPRPRGCAFHKRVFIGIGTWHRPRVANVFRKMTAEEIAERNRGGR